MKVRRIVQALVTVAFGSVCCGAMGQGADVEREIAELAAARHEGKENGWPHLQRALAAIAQAQEEGDQRAAAAGGRAEHGSIAVSEMLTGPLPREGLDEGHWYLRRARELGVFGELLDLARVGQAWRPPEEAGRPADMLERTQPLGTSRELARLMAASMRLAAVNGNADEQVAMFDALLALAGATADNLMVLDRLVAIALLRLGLDEARRQTVEGLIDGAGSERMLQAMHDRLPLAPVEASRRPEALHIIGMMEEMVADEMAVFDRDELIDALVEISRRDGPAPAEPDEEDFDPDAASRIMAQMVRESMAHALKVEPQSQMYMDATRIALGLEMYESREGAYPESLAALAPDILPVVPRDALSGLPFGYRRLAAPDEHGRGYLLWSAGADGEDNAGRAHPEGSLVALSERGAGFDVVLNEPRRDVE